jgi:hypothetical protein
MLIELQRVDGQLQVHVDGALLSPAPSQQLFNHSRGFDCGYRGSGPAQLALALLLAAGVDGPTAVRLHQLFKEELVTEWDPPMLIDYDVAGWALAMR